MRWISTRSPASPVTLSDAINQGLAPDGGLYVPESFPNPEKSSQKKRDPTEILAPFFEGDLLEPHLDRICKNALNFETPLRSLQWNGTSFGLLELFHGPTAAFKDVGARFLAECQSVNAHSEKTILVATSGDTGGAVAAAFHKRSPFKVVILFPKNGVSQRQFHQLTCWGENVTAFAVNGTFDDCQRMVKEAFQDQSMNRALNLTSANSINAGRLLPQMTYYARSSLEFFETHGMCPGFIIPSGNLGNALAALWAKQIGYPVGKIVLATNSNSVIHDFMNSGVFNPRPSIATLANAMDVGNPSNLERIRHLYPHHEDLKSSVSACRVMDTQIQEAIRAGIQQGEVICPHTATGIHALLHSAPRSTPWIVVATAHPAKFETIVEPILGKTIELPDSLKTMMNRSRQYQEIEPNLVALKKMLRL